MKGKRVNFELFDGQIENLPVCILFMFGRLNRFFFTSNELFWSPNRFNEVFFRDKISKNRLLI